MTESEHEGALPPAEPGDAPTPTPDVVEPAAHEPFRWAELLPVLCIVAAFVFAASAYVSRFVVPNNGDEVDTAWRFVWQLMAAKPKDPGVFAFMADRSFPWELGASHSGMYNLTFWLRSLAYGSEWVRENSDHYNRWFNLGMTAVMLFVVYGFARWMLDARYGLLVTFLAAFSHYGFFISLEGGYLNETSAVYLATAWAFLAGERSKSWKWRLVFGLLAGVGAVLCWMLYFSGRLITLALLGLCVVRFIEDKTWIRRNWLLLLAYFLVFAPAVGKFQYDLRARAELTAYRQTGTQLLYKPQVDYALRDYKTDSIILMTAKNVLRSFTAYAWGPNSYHAYQTPHAFLDRFSLPLAILGAIGMIWAWRYPPFLLLLGFFVMNNAILSGLTMFPYPPYHQRVHVGILLAAFAVALPLWWLTRLPRWWARVGEVIAVGVATFIVAHNAQLYAQRCLGGNDEYVKGYASTVTMASFINNMTPQYEFVVWSQGWNPYWPFDSQMATYNPFFRDASYRLSHWDNVKGNPTFSATAPGKRLVFILADPTPSAVESEIVRRFPNGRWLRETHFDKPFYSVYLSQEIGDYQP